MKIAIFWNHWSAKIATRVLRDCLALQRLARVNRANLLIACDIEMHPTLTSMGFQVTTNLVSADLVRVYLLNDEMTEALQARLPDCEDTELITVTPRPANNDEPEANTVDPYGGVKLFVDWKTIPNTMDKIHPPKGDSDPMFSPFL